MTNLKQIITSTPLGMIFLSPWLEKNGISAKSVHDHKKYGWLDVLGRGAFIKKGVNPTINAGINALQTQTDYEIHVGGRYALDEYHNIRHFLRNSLKPELWTSERRPLASWFQKIFKDAYVLTHTSFLPNDIGIQTMDKDGLKIKVSTPERALLEMLYDNNITTKESYHILELMTVLKPILLDKLLTQCKSVKVKRLFMYFASNTGYPWFKKIDRSKIDFGSSVRIIDKSGKFNKEYNLIVDPVIED